jgi:TolA-binding protein
MCRICQIGRIGLAVASLLVVTMGTQALAETPAGNVKRNELQRQQAQDELNLKIKQSQEANRPGLTQDQIKELQQQSLDQLDSQRQFQDDQSRRQQQLEHATQGQPAARQSEVLELQKLLFDRDKIQEPQRDESRPGPPEVVKWPQPPAPYSP